MCLFVGLPVSECLRVSWQVLYQRLPDDPAISPLLGTSWWQRSSTLDSVRFVPCA